MIKRMCAAVCVVAMVSLFGCAGCDRPTPSKASQAEVEMRQVKASFDDAQREKEQLQQKVEQLQGDGKKLETSLAEAEFKLAEATKAKDSLQQQVQDLTVSRGNLEAKVDELGKARTGLEGRVNDLTKSRDDLQKMVGSLVDTRGVLEKQVASLTKARNAALEDARDAQTKVDVLNDKLKVQTQQMIELQDQIKIIRGVLEQLQKKLE